MEPKISTNFLSFRLLADIKQLAGFVKTTDIIPAIKTDHAAIELNLTDSNQNSKGSGFWKMNVSFLEDPNNLEELN